MRNRALDSQSQRTLVETLRMWAETQPESVAYVSTADGVERALTYGELHGRAQGIARRLSSRVVPGATAILLYPLGLDFVEAFFGCLYAGIIAVPLPPGRGKSASLRLDAVIRDCQPSAILTSSRLAADLDVARERSEVFRAVELVETDREVERASFPALDFTPDPKAIAFLQYTSGSTSAPKGTMVTHENIMANQRMLEAMFGTGRATVIVTWLPIFHDMGLIGNVLHAAYLGGRAVLVSTLAFIKSPIVWLRAIQRHGADFSGGPNFAYDHCVAKTTPEERIGLDLSSWRVAFNGSEPVRKPTLEAFFATFAPHGLRRSALAPTYGLAEATLVVSGSSGRPPRYFDADARELEANRIAPSRSGPTHTLVSNGRCDHSDQRIAIVNPSTGQLCEPTEIGEICISGAHVAAGYWQNGEATQRAFRHTLGADGRTYLRTGDLGFVSDAELYVTGRLKDLLIFRGRKLYPQDLELTLERASARIRPGSTAAFAAGSDDEAGITIVAELARNEDATANLARELALCVQEEHEVNVCRLVLVPRGTVPKTTSGKIQRQACKSALAAGHFRLVAEWQPSLRQRGVADGSELVEFAANWVAQRFGLNAESVERDRALTALGVDSIHKVALATALEQRFALSIPESSFYAFETLNDLRALAQGTTAPPPTRPEATPASGAAVVLPAFSSIQFKVPRD